MTIYCKEWERDAPRPYSPAEIWKLKSTDGKILSMIKVEYSSKIMAFIEKVLFKQKNCTYYVYSHSFNLSISIVSMGYADSLKEAQAKVMERLNTKILPQRLAILT